MKQGRLAQSGVPGTEREITEEGMEERAPASLLTGRASSEHKAIHAKCMLHPLPVHSTGTFVKGTEAEYY